MEARKLLLKKQVTWSSHGDTSCSSLAIQCNIFCIRFVEHFFVRKKAPYCLAYLVAYDEKLSNWIILGQGIVNYYYYFLLKHKNRPNLTSHWHRQVKLIGKVLTGVSPVLQWVWTQDLFFFWRLQGPKMTFTNDPWPLWVMQGSFWHLNLSFF